MGSRVVELRVRLEMWLLSEVGRGSLAAVGSFVRRVKTASGATAVQIVHKRGRVVLGIDHIGSAHDDDQLALLLQTARERLHAGQQALELDLTPRRQPAGPGRPVVEAHRLADPVGGAGRRSMTRSGSTAVGDEAFRALVLARIIEPTSKVDTVRVLAELGVAAPSRATFMRCLQAGRRAGLPRPDRAGLLHRHATRGGGLALVLYDVTTLHFETPREDGLRKVGMSKERRVDPQVTVGLLTDRARVPAGGAPVRGQQGRDQDPDPGPDRVPRPPPDADDVVVVADAGMLSAANLLALEDAGFGFIVGSQDQQGPVRPGRALRAARQRLRPTGRPSRPPAPWAPARPPVTGGWSTSTSFKRVPARQPGDQRHDRTRREAVAAGKRPLKKDRFVKITDADTGRGLGPGRTRPLRWPG